ncbi:MAG: hypothetical protein JWP07_4771 [Pseudonocardiales bacterium]|nr:hypothetical protein [Pseudonocardiales bacterium]
MPDHGDAAGGSPRVLPAGTVTFLMTDNRGLERLLQALGDRQGLVPAAAAKGGVVTESAGVGVADDGLGGGDGAEYWAVGEAWGDRVDEVLELMSVGIQRSGRFA